MIRKQFAANVLPSMLAFAFSGIYAIVDGWFVGRNIGDIGLAAINVAYPIVAVMQAAGTGIGMGGAIQIAICHGSGKRKEEKEFLGNTLFMLVFCCILLTILLGVIYPAILSAFGATGELMNYAADYIRILVWGASFQIMGTGLLPIVRNYHGSVTAMAAMIMGFSTNVVLDWLFVSVYQKGVAGAAAATLIGQLVTVVPCVLFLFLKRIFHTAVLRPAKSVICRILQVALSPFGLTLLPNIVIIILNRGALAYGGELAVSCYAVVSYVVCVVQLLLQGIGDGSQPLIGLYHGAQNEELVKQVRRMAYMYAFCTSAVCMAGIFLLRHKIPVFFGTSETVAAEVTDVLVVFIAGFIFIAFLRITTAYFYAVKDNKSAYLLIYGEPCVLALLVAFALPRFLGVDGVWLSVPVGQAVLVAIGFMLLWRGKQKKESDGQESM